MEWSAGRSGHLHTHNAGPLAYASGVDLGTTLLGTGVYNVASGLLFGVPMPVHPMKSIAAVAIAEGPACLTVPQIMAAGLSTGAVLTFLGLSGLMTLGQQAGPPPSGEGNSAILRASHSELLLSSTCLATKTSRDKTGKSKGDKIWEGLDGRGSTCLHFHRLVHWSVSVDARPRDGEKHTTSRNSADNDADDVESLDKSQEEPRCK